MFVVYEPSLHNAEQVGAGVERKEHEWESQGDSKQGRYIPEPTNYYM